MRHPASLGPLSGGLLGLLLCLPGGAIANDDKTTTSTACTATSTGSGAFFDLRPDIAVKEGTADAPHGAPHDDYHARGFDYGFNFTLNICDPVVNPVSDVIGLKEELWRNVSAYYVSKGDVYSLGSRSGHLVSRGKELVLQYKDGSPCGSKKAGAKRGLPSGYFDGAPNLGRRGQVHEGASYRMASDDEDDTAHAADKGDTTHGPGGGDGKPDLNKPDTTKPSNPGSGSGKGDGHTNDPVRRKSSTILFSCDRDAVGAAPLVSFIASDPEECNYVFKVKSQHACAGAEPHKPGSVGPGSVFAIILVIAVLVYLLGGIFYNRTVSHARGWKQLPNYSLWANVWSFITDMFVIATSSCARCLPSGRGGYHHLAGSPGQSATRNSRDREAENRLIDQYDEEWDD